MHEIFAASESAHVFVKFCISFLSLLSTILSGYPISIPGAELCWPVLTPLAGNYCAKYQSSTSQVHLITAPSARRRQLYCINIECRIRCDIAKCQSPLIIFNPMQCWMLNVYIINRNIAGYIFPGPSAGSDILKRRKMVLRMMRLYYRQLKLGCSKRSEIYEEEGKVS